MTLSSDGRPVFSAHGRDRPADWQFDSRHRSTSNQNNFVNELAPAAA